MGLERKALLVVAVGSALTGVVGTLIYQDSFREDERTQSFASKPDAIKPPRPAWENKQPLQNNEAPPTARVQGADTAATPLPTSEWTLENPPDLKNVREDATRNPHAPPRSILEFAEQLASRMEGAFADREVRYSVSRQLIACAKDGQTRATAQAARALCLFNLERLKEKFPEEIEPAFQSLIAELPDDLIFVAGVKKNSGEQ